MLRLLLKLVIIAGITCIFIANYNFVVSADQINNNQEREINNINLKIYTIKDEPMILLRELAEKYNFLLSFNPADKVVSIYKNFEVVTIKIDESQFKGQKMNSSPVIKNGRTYLGLDWINPILENFNLNRVQLLTDISTEKSEFKPGEEFKVNIKAYNIYDETVTLNYKSGQLFDLYLIKGGKEIWRWSDGRFFTMALMSKDIETGDKLEYELEVPLKEEYESGIYIITGELATEKPLDLEEIEIEIIE